MWSLVVDCSENTASKNPLLSDMLGRLLPSDFLGIVDMGMWCFYLTVETCLLELPSSECLFGSAIPAFSRHVTIFIPAFNSNVKFNDG
jgi:hypothetical protein